MHSLEPPLPSGFFLVVRRKVLRGHPQLDLGWHVPKCATVVEESGIDLVLQSTWSENPSAGAHFALRWCAARPCAAGSGAVAGLRRQTDALWRHRSAQNI